MSHQNHGHICHMWIMVDIMVLQLHGLKYHWGKWYKNYDIWKDISSVKKPLFCKDIENIFETFLEKCPLLETENYTSNRSPINSIEKINLKTDTLIFRN